MAEQKFDSAFITPYALNGKKHKDYEKWVKQMNRIKTHADGIMPKTLIEERRPHESDEVKTYRELIFEPVTQDVPHRIIGSLGKIRRSQDWSITYETKNIPAKIGSEETLEQYCEKKFPVFGSLTNWYFSVCLTQYLIDPNGLIVVMPKDFNVTDDKYLQPFPYIFNSDKVLDFVSGKYAVIRSSDNSTYSNGAETYFNGAIFYVITPIEIQKWEQTDINRTLKQTVAYKHGLGFLPAFKMGGIITENNDNAYMYKSRIDGIVPRLNEASREYSDLQAEVVQHIHSEKWTYLSQDCTTCSGSGKVIRGTEIITCDVCKGMGKMSKSPYGTLVIRPGMPGETASPVPPGGYIQKQVEIVKVQDERIDKHLYMAMATCNMQFLWQTPLNQSGIAKEVDRDELNTFVYSIAEDSVGILDKLYFINNEYRYHIIVADKKARQAMLPRINVPEKYDLLSSSFYIDELSKAKTANVNPIIIQSMEIEYAGKKFNANPEIKNKLQLIFSLDPLAGLNDDQKQARLSNKGITQEDYVISCNIAPFIKKAMDEVKNFVTLDAQKQYEKLQEYAQEKMKANSSAEKIIETTNNPPQPAPPPANV